MAKRKRTPAATADPSKKLYSHLSHEVVFWLNGTRTTVVNPEPRMVLADYLRAPNVGLTGTKIGCKEGGCGACTVVISHWDAQAKTIVHNSVSSCLRPLATLDGACVTTIEGIGSLKTKLNQWQDKIAANNGSQCGFCTPGFVMSRYALSLSEPRASASDVETSLDGNLCRCTGYRPILRAFGASAPGQDLCPVIRKGGELVPANTILSPSDLLEAPFRPKAHDGKQFVPRVPKEAVERAKHPKPLALEGEFGKWFRATTLDQAFAFMRAAGKHGVYIQGNTSSGVLPRSFDPQTVFIDTTRIEELRHCEYRKTQNGIHIGGSVIIARLLEKIEDLIAKWKGSHTESLVALRDVIRLIGNTHIRNAGTVSGNLMLTHRQAGTSSPFPSDLFTGLAAAGATIYGVSEEAHKEYGLDLMTFVKTKFPRDFIVTGIWIPCGAPNELCKIYKVSRRKQNAHSIVNAGLRVEIDGMTATDATLIFGGVSDFPWRAAKTEAWLAGKPWNQTTLSKALRILSAELRKAVVPVEEGVSTAYRVSLARSLFYKFFVHVAMKVNPAAVSAKVRSASEHLEIPISRGQEEFEVFPREFPVSEPIVKLTAFAQASGEAKYNHDLAIPARTLEGAFILAEEARGTFEWKPSLDELVPMIKKLVPGVHDILTARDVPNPANNISGIGNDDPIFCPGEVTAAGQTLALVLANTLLQAEAAAHYIEKNCVVFKTKKPVLSMDQALALPKKQGIFQERPVSAPFLSYFDRVERPGSNQRWLKNPSKPPRGLKVVDGRQRTGEQMHFYLETQSALAIPGESGTMTVYSGTQDLDTLQNTVAQVLGIPVNAVTVGVGLVGGGFGGKTTRVPFFATPAALAAQKHQRPVRVILQRRTDSRAMGKRHPIDGKYHVLFTAQGEIKGYQSLNYVDGGNTYDCTFFVLDESQLNGDGAYMIPTYRTDLYAYRTNKSSNTAMRSFGVIQSTMVRESAMERVAHELGVLPETIREKNLYRTGTPSEYDLTPYGEALKDCDIRGLWRLMMKKSDFVAREKSIREFNARHRWKKRGIAMIPLKYGVAYARRMLNQGRSIVNVYHADGSLMLMHGGVEVGQGIHTKLAQIAAEALNVPLTLIRVPETNTRAIGNATSTGASTGTDLNGVAVHKAARLLRQRLEAFCLKKKQEKGEPYCIAKGIAFWKYKQGWRAKVKVRGSKSPSLMWANVVNEAWQHRIDLTSEAFYKTPHIMQLTDQRSKGRPYFYYTYGVSCSEVEVDVLTGEAVTLRADVIYENAKSLNPALDIGQVQGAFVQCLGNMTTEQVFRDSGGRLISFGTWDYKPPTSVSIPRDFRVTLLERAPVTQQAEKLVDQEALVRKTKRGAIVGYTAAQSSRTVGEPPFVLGSSVFFAIRRAVASARADQRDTDWFDLDAPATVEKIQQACNIGEKALRL